MLTDEEAMELMAEDMVIDLPIKHESKPYLMIPLPDGATNGDVIKALFPNVPVDNFFQDTISFYPLMPNGLTDEIHFDECWWNAPYKKESEE